MPYAFLLRPEHPGADSSVAPTEAPDARYRRMGGGRAMRASDGAAVPRPPAPRPVLLFVQRICGERYRSAFPPPAANRQRNRQKLGTLRPECGNFPVAE